MTKLIRITTHTETYNNFVNSIKKFPLLSQEEETKLITEYKKTKDDTIKEKLINSNEMFILSCAKRFSTNPDVILELVSEGNFGLVVAIDKFDETRGFKLITFAKDWILYYMRKYLLENVMVQRSNYLRIGAKISKIKNKFFIENGRNATPEDISEILKEKYNIEVKDMRDVMDVTYVSTDSPISDDDDVSVEDVSEFAIVTASSNNYENDIDNEDLHFKLNKVLLTFKERDRDIMKMFTGFDCDKSYTVAEIAEFFDLTPTRVSQIIKGIQRKCNKKSILKIMS